MSKIRRAKRMLEEAVPHVGRDVIVVAPGVNGQGYLCTSMSTRTSGDVDKILAMLTEATRKMRSLQRSRKRREARAELELAGAA